MSLKKVCPKCNKIISYTDKYCNECTDKIKDRHKDYKYKRNDKWEQSFYSSANWKRVRNIVKARDKGLCRLCLSDNTITVMDTVHHIVELKEDRSKALSSDNLICLCESCHQEVHKAYMSDKLKIQNRLRELISL